MGLKLKSDSKKFNKTPGSHGTRLRPEPRTSPHLWLSRMNRKFRYLVEWDTVQKEWAPQKMTISHTLQLAEEQAVELMAKPDAATLRDARERAQKLVQQLQGIKPPVIAQQPRSGTRLVLGGRGKSIDEMRQIRRTDNGV